MTHNIAFVCSTSYIPPVIADVALELYHLQLLFDMHLSQEADVVSGLKLIEEIERLDLIVMDSELMPGDKTQNAGVEMLCKSFDRKDSLHIRLALHFLKTINNSKRNANPPVVVLSNYPQSGPTFFPDIERKFLDAGASKYIHYQRYAIGMKEGLVCDLTGFLGARASQPY